MRRLLPRPITEAYPFEHPMASTMAVSLARSRPGRRRVAPEIGPGCHHSVVTRVIPGRPNMSKHGGRLLRLQGTQNRARQPML